MKSSDAVSIEPDEFIALVSDPHDVSAFVNYSPEGADVKELQDDEMSRFDDVAFSEGDCVCEIAEVANTNHKIQDAVRSDASVVVNADQPKNSAETNSNWSFGLIHLRN